MKDKNQVELYNLLFAQNWEDPDSDIEALKIGPKDSMVTITSGACNTLGFLISDPEIIYAVDINPRQSYLLELKMAAIKNLDFNDYISFMGLKDCHTRLSIYEYLKKDISQNAIDFWDHNTKILSKGIIMNGKYERFVRIISKLIRLIQGGKRVNGLFSERTIPDQEKFYQKMWNTWRTRLIFNLFFNKVILARGGLDTEYFHFDDGAKSFAESFFNRFSKVLTRVKTSDNYFLHLYLKGRYLDPTSVPPYLQESCFPIIKDRLSRIRNITADAKKWLSELPDNSIDCYSLSNICELMSLSDTEELFQQVYRTAKNGSRIVFRNLIITRNIPVSLENQIKLDEVTTEKIFQDDRSFVYGKVAAYKVFK